MQRLFLSLAVVFLGCLAIPGNLNAQDANYYFNRGLDWAKKGDYDKAIADYNQAMQLSPSHTSSYHARCWRRTDTLTRSVTCKHR